MERDAESYAVIGAAMHVHRVLGCGFLEAVYRAALALELCRRDITFKREVVFPLSYEGRSLGLSYHADLVCFDSLIVEVKALARIGSVEQAQAINYLKASGLHRALVLNFGARSLEFRRIVY